MNNTIITAENSGEELMLRDCVIAFKAGTNGTLQLQVKLDEDEYVDFDEGMFNASFASRAKLCTAVIRFTVTGDGKVIVYNDED